VQRLVIDAAQRTGQQIDLTAQQQHYLVRVLRLEPDARFIVLDGKGGAWVARLVKVATDRFQAELLAPLSLATELPVTVTLVAALPKGSGFDEVVRQATELGVSQIVPVRSDRTLLHPSPHKVERWRRIAQEAAEQSERPIIPTILEPLPFTTWLQQADALSGQSARRYLCVTRQSAPHLLHCLLTGRPDISPMMLAIGPEGGWTEAEVEAAIVAGYQPVSLGNRILRAVTAPLVALSLVAASYEQGASPQSNL